MQKLFFSFVIFTTPLLSHAAGFALSEQSGSGLGNAFAGAAASAEDASTIFFNPAGMTYIDGTQVVGTLHLIKPNAEFNNQGSVAGTARPLGSESDDAGSLAFVPNFYFMTPLTETVKFGVGVNAPFGLKTEYDRDWIGRFQGIKSDLKTVNINPSLAFKVNDQLSLGFGLSAMWIQAELTNAVNLGGSERTATVKGDDWGFGYNLGAIYQVTNDTRLGIAYRSKIDQHLKGDVRFSVSNGPTPNGDVTADTTLPEMVSISSFSQLNDQWDLLSDVTWTRWSRFQDLTVLRDNGALLSSTAQNWENTLRYSIGVNYHYNDKLKFRAGVAYDETPTSNEFRTVRIPDNDRKWLSFGVAWQARPDTKLDIGYAHLFVSDVKIDDNQTTAVPLGRGRVRGEYDASVDILSVQLTHNF
ncbi:MAG: aromatic hydrocarbon degradation protein [Proteobacteria bacterium ST_bin12]|nr:MAG: aromatic hydrocarbon degradation protein [Proteobacteria bacterium ST_bin12]